MLKWLFPEGDNVVLGLLVQELAVPGDAERVVHAAELLQQGPILHHLVLVSQVRGCGVGGYQVRDLNENINIVVETLCNVLTSLLTLCNLFHPRGERRGDRPQRVLHPQQWEEEISDSLAGLQGFYHIKYSNYSM